MIRSTRPRARAGIISSIAELIAEYSPPIPAPVKKRAARNQTAVVENAVATVAQQVERQRDQEELLAPEAVGELAEEERADTGAGDVDRLRERDVARR